MRKKTKEFVKETRAGAKDKATKGPDVERES